MTIIATATGNISEPKLNTNLSKPVLNFTLAVNHRRKNQQSGQWEESGTTFIQTAVWGDYALTAAETLAKGQMVTVTGRLETQRWTDQQGQERDSLRMNADEVAANLRFQHAKVAKAPKPGEQQGGFTQQPQQSTWGQHDAWSGQPSGGGWDAPGQPAPF